MTTISYGTWNSRVQPYEQTVEQTVLAILNEQADRYDLDAVCADYRNAIDQALPDGVTLAGNEFHGPCYPEPGQFDGYPRKYGHLDIKTIVAGIDLEGIAAARERR